MNTRTWLRTLLIAITVAGVTAAAQPAHAGLYGGGVAGTCTIWHVLRLRILGVDPRYCVYDS